MKYNAHYLLLILGIFTHCTITTGHGMTQTEQHVTDLTNATEITNESHAKPTDDIDKLVALLRKSFQPTFEDKAVTVCTAAGLGGIIGVLAGGIYDKLILDEPDLILNSNSGQFEKEQRSIAIVRLPVGLLAAGLSYVMLKKIFQPKNSFAFKDFAEKLNNFKIMLEKSESLSEEDQINIKKLSTLASTIFEKTNDTSIATIIKKATAMLGSGLMLSMLTSMSHNASFRNILNKNHPYRSKSASMQRIPAFIAGAGLALLIANKFLEGESINIKKLQEVIVNELYDFLPNEISTV